MTTEPRRDPATDHLLTPENAVLVVIDYQPSNVVDIVLTTRLLASV